MTSARGHRVVEHTADVRIEAWASTRDEAVSEAVTALAETYADWPADAETVAVVLPLEARADTEVLVEVLDDAVFLADTEEMIALAAQIATNAVHFSCLPAHDVAVIGAAPKGISWSGLGCTHSGGRWRCTVTIDV